MKIDEKTHKEIGKYLMADPEICHGKLTFRGTRIPVETVLTYLALGDSIEDVLKNWPRLHRPAVEEAIRFAARLVNKNYPARRKAA
ncbi:DUF433 domain-containing protein [candidate division KSB1 bacterium]|nr:DUF433 domain-containing protein [candidate division KSB1 bacterium]